VVLVVLTGLLVEITEVPARMLVLVVLVRTDPDLPTATPTKLLADPASIVLLAVRESRLLAPMVPVVPVVVAVDAVVSVTADLTVTLEPALLTMKRKSTTVWVVPPPLPLKAKRMLKRSPGNLLLLLPSLPNPRLLSRPWMITCRRRPPRLSSSHSPRLALLTLVPTTLSGRTLRFSRWK
jgi:hypothetical protein